MEDAFAEGLAAFLAAYPALSYEWRHDKTELLLKKKQANGFDITLGCRGGNYLYVSTDRGYHDGFEAAEDLEGATRSLLGLVRDLLSGVMRIKEISAGGRPRKWVLQYRKHGRWQTEQVVGRLFWNFFARSTERLYSNDTLPPRG